jgi:hypothetical protein
LKAKKQKIKNGAGGEQNPEVIGYGIQLIADNQRAESIIRGKSQKKAPRNKNNG